MSEESSKQVHPQPPKSKVKSKLLVATSYGISAAILVWACWVPIQAVRSDPNALTGGRLDVEEQFEARRISAQEVRRNAIAMDEQFMRQVRVNREARTANKPTSEQTRQWQVNRIEHVQRRIKQLGNPAPGTVQWGYQQDLIKSLEDTPPL